MTDAVVAPVAGASLPELRLKQREDRRISAGHLWIFSNEVDTGRTPLTSFASGALCRVVGDRDRFLGYAYVNPHALICARILGRDPRYPPGKSLFVHRLQVALALRERSYSTPWYRLAYGESDGLPGVVFERNSIAWRVFASITRTPVARRVRGSKITECTTLKGRRVRRPVACAAGSVACTLLKYENVAQPRSHVPHR